MSEINLITFIPVDAKQRASDETNHLLNAKQLWKHEIPVCLNAKKIALSDVCDNYVSFFCTILTYV
jgi:hypothetical protein